jgi:hypothetical protein
VDVFGFASCYQRGAGSQGAYETSFVRERRTFDLHCSRSIKRMGGFLSSKTSSQDTWKSDARYAMEEGTYCVICGSPFDIEGDIYNQDPIEPRYQVSALQN